VDRFVFAIVRGDMDVNETKLANAVKAKALRPATDAEIRDTGAVPGYGSPIGIEGVIVVVDDLIAASPNLVSGANDAAMRSSKGVELGNIFKLGPRYCEAMGGLFLDRDGQARPVIMGSYGIGVGRLLASVAEAFHDEQGLMWPITVAPYQVYLVALKGGEEAAERLYADLRSANVEVLYDERDERAGVKFNDADLIGIPIRLTVSRRSLEAGGVELKLRRSAERTVVPQAEIVSRVRDTIETLQAEIADGVVTVPYSA
jgi:prolyl-tRNA synthetase